MKTEFVVIWVDDNAPFAESIEIVLRDWLDEKGLELRVIMHKDASNVLNDVRNTDVELIIIDYRLPGDDGDILIDRIRESEFYHDIIFYSGGELPEKQFDGVFYVSKEDADSRIKKLIELKLKRLSDPISVRGWIVADSIELEVMLTDLLMLCFTTRDGFTFSKRLFVDSGSPSIDFGGKYILLNGILKDHIKALNDNPEQDTQTLAELRECRKVFNKFMDEIIHVRNAIAHQSIEELDSGTIKVIKTLAGGTDDIKFEEESFVSIRRNLRKHHDNLQNIKKLLAI